MLVLVTRTFCSWYWEACPSKDCYHNAYLVKTTHFMLRNLGNLNLGLLIWLVWPLSSSVGCFGALWAVRCVGGT